MRVFVFACLASLLVAPTALLGTPLHAARRPQVLAQEQTTPDIDSIMSVPSSSFRDYRKGRIRRGHAGRSTFSSGSSNETTLPPWNCTTSPILTWGDVDNNTINSGVTITNGDTEWRAFFMYHNRCDYSPWKYIWISPGATRFVSLPALFEGRVVRGSDEVRPLMSTLMLAGSSARLSLPRLLTPRLTSLVVEPRRDPPAPRHVARARARRPALDLGRRLAHSRLRRGRGDVGDRQFRRVEGVRAVDPRRGTAGGVRHKALWGRCPEGHRGLERLYGSDPAGLGDVEGGRRIRLRGRRTWEPCDYLDEREIWDVLGTG